MGLVDWLVAFEDWQLMETGMECFSFGSIVRPTSK
jgi:hypothetical protein